MADLRGEQLKDSYQNVVTRGTGNKLENGNGVEFADLDDKASLSALGSMAEQDSDNVNITGGNAVLNNLRVGVKRSRSFSGFTIPAGGTRVYRISILTTVTHALFKGEFSGLNVFLGASSGNIAASRYFTIAVGSTGQNRSSSDMLIGNNISTSQFFVRDAGTDPFVFELCITNPSGSQDFTVDLKLHLECSQKFEIVDTYTE